MDPLTIAMLAQGIPALVQGGVGIGQFISGKKAMKDNERPTFEIPEYAQEALGLRKTLAASQEMPGMAQAETALNQQLATGAQLATQTAGTTAEALGAIQNMYANRMAGQNRLFGQAAEYNVQMDEALASELGRMAEWEKMQFDINEMQPFLDKAAMASAMAGTGMQNAFQGLEGVGGAIAGYKMNQEVLGALEGAGSAAAGAAKSATEGDLGGSFTGAINMTNGSGGSGMTIPDLIKKIQKSTGDTPEAQQAIKYLMTLEQNKGSFPTFGK